jgi:hypothetical protein
MSENDKFDDLFAQMRGVEAAPSQDLLNRVLLEARAVQDEVAPQVTLGFAKPSGWRAFLQELGGWRAISGLATAGVVGVWIGIAPPDSLSQTVNQFINQIGTGAAIETFPDPFTDLLEG